MTAVAISLEAAGTELHIVIAGRVFELPVADGIVPRRAVIDLAYDACISMTDLGTLYRAVEGMAVQFDGPAYSDRF